jgi:hypothetical protein
MPAEEIIPYDFSSLNDMYLSADEYEDTAAFISNDLTKVEEQAWSSVDRQTTDDARSYLRKLVIAAWRSIELKYANRAATRRAQVSTFRNAIILDALLRSDGLDEDVLAITSQYTRDELLQIVTDASAPWLVKYTISLDYDSEIEYKGADWHIFISV